MFSPILENQKPIKNNGKGIFIFNQAINDPLIMTLLLLSFGAFSAIMLCIMLEKFSKFVTFIMGDE